MKYLASSALLIGVSAASQQAQQVFQAPLAPSEAWMSPFHDIQSSLKSLSAGVRAIFDEVASVYPEDVKRAFSAPPPKKHSRRPDTEWDHITRGSDVQSVWVENADGEMERKLHGNLKAYDLRTRVVDPGALGVDPNVTQYSGYLDDNENDKHLFYCSLYVLNLKPSIANLFL